MNKNEREILLAICHDVENSDDKIEVLERLYFEIKKILKHYQQDTKNSKYE